jgi:hypothetical protein
LGDFFIVLAPKGAVFHLSDKELFLHPNEQKSLAGTLESPENPGVASPLFSIPIVRRWKVIFGNHPRWGQRPSARGTYGDGFPGLKIETWSLLQNSIESAKCVRTRLESCRKSNKIMLGLVPAVFVFSNLQFRSG